MRRTLPLYSPPPDLPERPPPHRGPVVGVTLSTQCRVVDGVALSTASRCRVGRALALPRLPESRVSEARTPPKTAPTLVQVGFQNLSYR